MQCASCVLHCLLKILSAKSSVILREGRVCVFVSPTLQTEYISLLFLACIVLKLLGLSTQSCVHQDGLFELAKYLWNDMILLIKAVMCTIKFDGIFVGVSS